MEKNAPVNDFGEKASQCQEIRLQVTWVMTSFRCYRHSDDIVTLITTNFHLYLIQLLQSFSQIFVKWRLIKYLNLISIAPKKPYGATIKESIFLFFPQDLFMKTHTKG